AFGANALTYMSSEHEVADAFEMVQQSGALTEASQNFKAALSSMRGAATEFASRPSHQLVTDFAAAHRLALVNLQSIERILGPSSVSRFAGPRRRVEELRERFTSLTEEQKRLGMSDNEGIRAALR